MKMKYKFGIILFIFLLSLSVVSATNETSSNSIDDSLISENSTVDEIQQVVSKDTVIKDNKIISKDNKEAINTVKPVTVYADDVKGYSNNNVTFKGSVVDVDNNPVSEGRLVIKFNGKTHIWINETNGSFNYNYVMPDYSAKDYKLQYVYVGTDNYSRYELNKTLTLMDPSTKLNISNDVKAVKVLANNVKGYPNSKITFKGSVVDVDNNPVSEGRLVIKFNGKTHIRTEVKNGSFSFNYVMPDYSAKDYKLQYVYVGTDSYGRYELNKTLKLVNHIKNITINAGPISTRAGDDVIFNGVVFDENKNIVPYGNIVIKLNGKTHIKTEVKDGLFNYTYKMPKYSAKQYALQYVYVQNNEYNRYELNKTLTVFNKKISTTIITDNVETYYGDIPIFNGTVVDSNNNKVTEGKVLIKFNGKSIIWLNLVNGTFSYKYPINFGHKNYLLTYTYSYNDKYTGAVANRIMTVLDKEDPKTKVIINANNLFSYVGQEILVNGTVVDENGNNVTKGDIELYIVNKTLKQSIKVGTIGISNGVFSGSLILSDHPGNYSIKYAYIQNDKYSRYELNKTYTAIRQPSKILSLFDDEPSSSGEINFIEISSRHVHLEVNIHGTVDGKVAETGKLAVKINGKTITKNNKTVYFRHVGKYNPDEGIEIPIILEFDILQM